MKAIMLEEPEPESDVKQAPTQPKNEELIKIHVNLKRSQMRLKTPGVVRADNRYPAYVILSTKSGLIAHMASKAPR
jgi:hypothetical protein